MCDDYDYYLFQKISYPSLIVIDNFSVPMCNDYDYYLFQKISYPSLIVIDNFSVPMCDDYDYYLFQKKSYPSLIPRRKLVQKTFNDGKLKLQCIPKKGKAKVNDLLYYKKNTKTIISKR